jgi:hypothetical protein
MRRSCVVLLAFVLAVGACRKAGTPATQTHVVNVWMDGVRTGEERATASYAGQRVTLDTDTTLTGPLEARLEGTLLIERGRATSLLVVGHAPAPFPSAIDVTTTPDRTDTFPIGSSLPVHVVAALVRQSITAGRRTFRTLPQGEVTIGTCPDAEGPFRDATCHAVAGLPGGNALVWLDPRGNLVALVARTDVGTLVATAPGREGSHASLLERFDVYSAR